MSEIRYVKFKNVVYDLRNGDSLEIIPIPPTDTNYSEYLIEFGLEKYLIETTGNLKAENIDENTLKNFNIYLSEYLEALRRLT